jgi:hypothetical protein
MEEYHEITMTASGFGRVVTVSGDVIVAADLKELVRAFMAGIGYHQKTIDEMFGESE